MLKITQEHLNRIAAHGQETYPEECIGAILGSAVAPNNKTIVELLPFDNVSPDNRERRALVTGDMYRVADKTARDKKLDIVGWYHSHPDVDAIPSQFDLDHALPFFSYVIVSVKKGQADHTRSWLLVEDRSRFEEEELV